MKNTQGSASARYLRDGFTLIETLVYLALFAIIIGGVCVAVYAIVEASGRSQSRITLQEEGGFLLGKLNWALTGANNFTVTVSPPGLLVNKYAFASNPLVFKLNANKLGLKEGSGPLADLNSDAVEVVNLVFQDIPAQNGQPEGVKSSFTLKAMTPNGATISQDFQSVKYVRK